MDTHEKVLTQEEQEEQKLWLEEKEGLWSLWFAPLVFLAFIVASMTVMAWVNFPLGGLVLSTTLFWLWNGVHEVKDPEMAVLFALGKIKYRLKPGWYVVLIPFQELEKESMAWQALHVKEDGKPNEEAEMSDLYYIEDSSRGDGGSTGGTKEGERSPKRSRPIKIRVGMRVFYRLKNPVGAIRTYGELSSQAFCNDLDSTSKSALRSVLGKNSFDKLLTEKETLEQEIAKSVNKELNHIADQLFNENMKLKDAPSGYVTGSIDLHYMKEEVRSKASETTELADADSYRVRRMVSATAEPLKGNPEAARVNVAEIVSNAARDIASGLTNALVGGGRGEKKASSKGEKSDEVRVSKEQLKKFVENL